MAIKDIVLKLVVDGKESLITVDKFDSKISGLGKSVKSLAGAMGLAFGSAQIIGFMKDAIALAQRENEVIGKLNATLQSTGYAAGMTANELIELANNLEEINNYKFDDKDIIDAEGLLLTFKRINKEVFPQAIQLAMDLSVRFNQDLSTSVKQLGKALDDPERGLTALRKAGVIFSEQQEKQIKAFIKTNNLMGAQKIILAELTSQVAGNAAASVDEFTAKWNKVKDAIEGATINFGRFIQSVGIGVYQFGQFLGLVLRSGNVAEGTLLFNQMMADERFNKYKSFIVSPHKKTTMTGLPVFGEDEKSNTKYGNPFAYQDYTTSLRENYFKEYFKEQRELLDLRLNYYKNQNELKQQKKERFLGKMGAVTVPEFDPLGGMTPDQIRALNFEMSALDMTIASVKDGFMDAGSAAVNAATQSIHVFKNANSVLQIFVNTLVKATIQALAMKAVTSIIGFLFPGSGNAVAAIPGLAGGGIVSSPTLSMVGESGPEAIIPLDRFENMKSSAIEDKLDEVKNAFLNKQFEIDMNKWRTVNKRIDVIEKSLSLRS